MAAKEGKIVRFTRLGKLDAPKPKRIDVETADCLKLISDGGATLYCTRNRVTKITTLSFYQDDDGYRIAVSDEAIKAFARGLNRLVKA